MSEHPINLTVRFLMEICTLYIYGLWGWYYGAESTPLFFAVILPLTAGHVQGRLKGYLTRLQNRDSHMRIVIQ